MGAAVCVPLVELTGPMPLIEAEVAPLTSHCNVNDWPGLIEAGIAVKEVTVGRVAGLSVTVADEVTGPGVTAGGV